MRRLGLFLLVLVALGAQISNAAPVRVLALDGGGIRGMLEAYYLMQLEAAAKKPAYQMFDLIAGTSTGGLIALGLTMPSKDGQPIFTAEQLYDLYAMRGDTIFQKTWHFLGLSGPQYKASALEQELKSYFADVTLRRALTPVLVTAYNLTHESGVLFSSAEARKDPDSFDYPAWLVARATSAAPTYFEPLRLEVPKGAGREDVLVDGGLYRNNPALLAYLKAREMFPNREIEVYSFGTGRSERPVNIDAPVKGATGWVGPVLHHMFVAVSQGDSEALHHLLNQGGKETNYFRINTRLEAGRDSLDDTSKSTIAYLEQMARKVVNTKQFRTMAANLLERKVEDMRFPLREHGRDLVPQGKNEEPFVLIPE